MSSFDKRALPSAFAQGCLPAPCVPGLLWASIQRRGSKALVVGRVLGQVYTCPPPALRPSPGASIQPRGLGVVRCSSGPSAVLGECWLSLLSSHRVWRPGAGRGEDKGSLLPRAVWRQQLPWGGWTASGSSWQRKAMAWSWCSRPLGWGRRQTVATTTWSSSMAMTAQPPDWGATAAQG